MTGHDVNRERQVIQAFVDLSSELVDDYDVLEMLGHLTRSCAALLDVESAGLLLADGRGVLQVAASSSERTHHLEVFQLQRDEGPCLDCYHQGRAVVAAGPDEMERRWPDFARAAGLVGFTTVHALPMRLREHVLGTLGLFGGGTGSLDADDVALAQALVHVATVALLNEKSAVDRATVNAQLQRALTSRIVLEQAKGVIAASGELDMQDAFNVLRRYARDHGRHLSDVASDVVERVLRGPTLLEHARSVSILPS
jgi:transcriptional regulator with GAF, ATPase, and Fis domain